MIRIEIPSDTPNRTYEFKGVTYAEQEAAIFVGSHYPKPFHVTTKHGEAYPKGSYTLDPKSFEVDDKGRLLLKRVRLLPVNGKA